MKTNAKGLMSFLLAMCMILCTVPMVFADGEGDSNLSGVTLVDTYPKEGQVYYWFGTDSNKSPAKKVILAFSELLSDTAENKANYTITGGSYDVVVSAVTKNETSKSYTLTFDKALEDNVKYTVSFPNLTDASGKKLSKTSFSFYSMPMTVGTSITDGEGCYNGTGWAGAFIQNATGKNIVSYDGEDSTISKSCKIVFEDTTTEQGNRTYHNQVMLYGGAWNAIRFPKGQKYVVSFRYKPTKAEKNASLIIVEGQSAHDNDTAGEVYTLDTTEWQTVNHEYTSFGNSALYLCTKIMSSTINPKFSDNPILFDDIKIYQKPTYTVDTANSYPSDTEVVMPTDTIKVKYTGPMSEAALNKANYTISGVTTDGAEAPISITSVNELGGNVYELKLSAETANMAKYTVAIKNMTDFLGSAVADANIRFISGETILRENHFNAGEPTIGDPSSVVRNFYATPTTRAISDDDATGVTGSKSVKATITSEPGQGLSGSYYYRLYPFGDKDRSNGNWIDDYKFTVGQKYRVKFSYKADENLDYTINLYHGENVFNSKYPTFKFTTNWQTYDEVITADFSDNLHLYLNSNFINKPVYLDDIKLSQPMTKPTTAATVTDKATGALGTNEVTLTFSDQMDATSVANKANYTLKNGEDAVEGGIKSVVYNASEKKAVVTLDKISPNTAYTLEYKNLEDFYFNKVEDGTHTVRFNADVKVYGDVKLYGADAEVTALGDEAAEITAKFDGVMNYSGKDVNVKLIVAYFENGVLKDVKTSDAEVKNNQVLTDAISAKVNAGAKADGVTRSVKAFVFNGSTLAPLNGGASAGEPVATPGE